MGSNSARKHAINEYKNRPPRRGVFAVRCAATGHTWVGATRDLDAARNGLWFTLRVGSHRDAALQAEWQEHGEDAFQYEVLEKLEPDISPISVSDALKEKKRKWTLQAGARTLLP